VVTTVRYGSRPRATVRRTETAFPIKTSVDDLARFVAQASAEREELGVASVDIEVPAEVLRLGFCFVDTPGSDRRSRPIRPRPGASFQKPTR